MAFVNNFSTSFRWWDHWLGTDLKYQGSSPVASPALSESPLRSYSLTSTRLLLLLSFPTSAYRKRIETSKASERAKIEAAENLTIEASGVRSTSLPPLAHPLPTRADLYPFFSSPPSSLIARRRTSPPRPVRGVQAQERSSRRGRRSRRTRLGTHQPSQGQR